MSLAPNKALLRAVLDHRIRLSIYDVPDDLDDHLIEALCIPNREREEAQEQHIWGWQEMPEKLVMYGLTPNGTLDIPRGFANDLVSGLDASGVDIEFDDRRAKPAKFRLGSDIELREHQGPAVDAILGSQQGIYKAPPGSGKTVAVLAAGRRLGTKCIIIVNTKDILNQWIARIQEHLGHVGNIGRIGDNEFSIGHVWTVATAQTLHSRFDQLEAEGFFDSFGFMCLDECHHATAETYMRIVDRFSSQIRIGVSATPDKTGDFKLAQMILGPVFHTTTEHELEGKGHLIKPTIVRVKTDFGYAFRPTTSRWSRSNYPQMVQAIITDHRRNRSIVNAVMRESGHHCLLLTKRHEHIDIIEAMLEEARYEYPILRLTGKEKSDVRDAVLAQIAVEPGLVLSTLADEAVDVPRIDRGFLAFPQRNTGLITQQIGRFARTHPDKRDAKVYDWADVKVTALKSQWTTRRLQVYKKRGFKILNHDIEEYL